MQRRMLLQLDSTQPAATGVLLLPQRQGQRTVLHEFLMVLTGGQRFELPTERCIFTASARQPALVITYRLLQLSLEHGLDVLVPFRFHRFGSGRASARLEHGEAWRVGRTWNGPMRGRKVRTLGQAGQYPQDAPVVLRH